MPVRYACGHASVIEVTNGAVVTHFPVLQKQVREIGTPFLIWPVCMKILFQPVLEHFVGLGRLRPRLFGADDGAQSQLLVHIFMYGGSAVTVSPALQVNRHAAVTVNTIMAVVYLFYLFFNFCFFGVIFRFSLLPVVIVGIRTDFQPPQQPANAEFLMVLLDKSISL